MQEKEYLDLLIQSLQKKLVLLNRVAILSKEQCELLQDEDMTPDDFDRNVRMKADLIDQIVALDAGFDEVYAHLKDLMERDHALYEDQLSQMRELIRRVMELDASIRTKEQENYKLAGEKFAAVKSRVRRMKVNQKMVNTYYKTMMRRPGEPVFLDNKK